ncbi:MAG: hypothetical protein M0Z46_16620 [Actinomycetota bacterium]|jgi:hypothetical protein|nr:hypothetical protein [Actinomycetota bacterium]
MPPPDRKQGAAHAPAHGERHASREIVTATVVVAASYAAIEQALRVGPDQLIALAYLRAATTEDGRFHAVLTTRGWRRWLRFPATIEFFRPASGSPHAIVHLSWRSSYSAELFPVMEADLGLRPVSENSTELVLSGEYRPPGGIVGLLVDRLVGGRVAVSTAEAFVEDLAAAIEQDLARPKDAGSVARPDERPG